MLKRIWNKCFYANQCIFRFGGSKGTTLKLNDSIGSSIKMNGLVIFEREDFSGAHYTFDTSFMEGKYTFNFIDADKKKLHKLNYLQ